MQRSLLGFSFARFSRWRRQRRVQNAGTLVLVILAPILVVTTYFVLGPLDQGASAPLLRLILLADLVYILVVAALVMQRIAQMISARRARSAGSRLHLRLTGVFALLALIPTVLVAVFAMLTVNVGLEGWFSDRVRQVVSNSLSAAEAYEEEHRKELTRDGSELAGALNTVRQATFFMSSGELRQVLGRLPLQTQRSLQEIYVIDGTGQIIARGPSSYEFGFERPTTENLTLSLETGITIIEDWDNNEFRAILPLDAFVDRFLYVSRDVDGQVLSLLDETQETVVLYEQLENDRGRILFEFGLLYLGFAVIMILAAIWVGLWFAERLARPIGRLAGAAQRVGAGDLGVTVREEEGDDEIAMLGRYFNQMTTQLKGQRDTLLESNEQIERRRRLFDSVLTSITSGVVGLDANGRVAFANPSARRLLEVGQAQEAMALSVAVPEFGPLYDRLIDRASRGEQDQINLTRGGQQESLLVRMAPRRSADGTLEGYVVAFDDVTDLVSAQRTAAWGDVARRIAHEIKNPLTPIQLSAERIKRKFRPMLGENAADLEQMTDVIIRQTDGLRRIVDEFSKFARMPEPEKSAVDLIQVLRDAVLLQEAGQPNVTFHSDFPEVHIRADLDQNMISQALTNLIKNAGEAIESLVEKQSSDNFSPTIKIALTLADDTARIEISDNGIGLPPDRTRLFEPYVTTRDSGTGLGLPIVKKIIEEHGGQLVLADAEIFENNNHAGAKAIVTLPIKSVAPIMEKQAV